MAVSKAQELVMYQSADILSDQMEPINIADTVRYDHKLFFLTRDTCSLYEYDTLTEKMKWCGFVKKQIDQIFICMSLCEGKIYIAPYEADMIVIYDIESGSFDNIVLKQPEGKRKNKYYHLCFSHGQCVYFFGNRYSSMLSLNTQTGSVCEIIEWMDELEQITGQVTAVTTIADKCIVGDFLWVAVEGNNVLLQYNMLTGNYKLWHIGKTQMQYVTINFDGKYFWLSGNRKVVVRWDKENNDIKEITVFPDKFEVDREQPENLFYCCYSWNGFFYFVPWDSNMLIKFDPKTEEMKCVLMKNDPHHFGCELVELNDRELYIEMMNEGGSLRCSYVVNAEDEYHNFSISADREAEIKCEMENQIVLENHLDCLKIFLEKNMTEGNGKENICCRGMEIYQSVSGGN